MRCFAVSWNGEHICIYYDSGTIWLGNVDQRYCVTALAGGGHKEIAWCSDEAVVVFSRASVAILAQFWPTAEVPAVLAMLARLHCPSFLRYFAPFLRFAP